MIQYEYQFVVDGFLLIEKGCFMKRCLFLAVLLCLLALLFVACGDTVSTTDPITTQKGESSGNNETTTTASVTTEDTVNEAKRAELEALMKKDIQI